MKKLALLMLLCFVGCYSGYAPKYPVNDHYRSAYLASVGICDQQGTAIGAGTIIENEAGKPIRIVTAGHVVLAMARKDTMMFACFSHKRDMAPLVPVVVDATNDLALLKSVETNKEDGPSARLAKHEPQIGDHIFLIGSPMGNMWNVTSGIVSNYVKRGETRAYRVDADAFYGNSGGGAFNDAQELEGVLVGGEIIAGIAAIPGGGHVVALPYILALLKK